MAAKGYAAALNFALLRSPTPAFAIMRKRVVTQQRSVYAGQMADM
jgi:hypothetical protein